MRTLLRRGRDHEEGAAAVEFALVLPLLVLLVFGIIEFGMTFRDTLTIASSTRAGARTASALSRDLNYTTATVAAVTEAVGALPDNSIEQLWIYKADPNGYPIGRTDFSSGCNSCTIWDWVPATRTFQQVGGPTWPSTSQNACINEADSVGIYLKVRHEFVTQLFGAGLTLTDHTVMRLEPRSSLQACK